MYIIYNEAFNHICHLCVQDIQLQFHITGALHYISVYLKISKTYPFQQGMEVITGCSDTQVCWTCVAWDLFQHHQTSSSAPTAPFLQVADTPHARVTMVGHIKSLLKKLGLKPGLYADNSMRIRGATMTIPAGLTVWEIKSLVWWRSNTYQSYIMEDLDMWASIVRRMATVLPSSTFSHLKPYPVKDNG